VQTADKAGFYEKNGFKVNNNDVFLTIPCKLFSPHFSDENPNKPESGCNYDHENVK